MMICNISHASTLVSSTIRVAIPSSCGKDASTIWLKCPLLSPPLNLYIRHIASIQCKPAKTEAASLVFNSCIVISRKLGHLAGKSYDNIFCRIGMSCIRTWGDEDANIGKRRFRRSSFSSSGIGFCATESPFGCHALVTRFLRYTTAGIWISGASIRQLENVLERRMLLSCSACSMSRRALVKPGCSSALSFSC